MNVHINQLVKSLLQKDSIEQCSLQELQQFADSNPHFGAAQLLLTKKLKAENSDRYNEQLQKTFLYFHNPLWVEHLLNETGGATIKPGQSKAEAILPVTVGKSIIAEVPSSQINEPVNSEPIIAAPAETITVTETAINKTTISENAPTTLESMVAAPEVSIPENLAVPGSQQPAAVAEETGLTNPAFTNVAAKEDLLFEPYHTVDYFASQGIKLKEADKGTDKFSQQLRSFTDWLKTLKKAPTAEIAKQPETVSEKKVEQMAAHSLQDGGVVTETMAEVWEKQGNTAKAIDLYSKLSLLEPDKSAYFAAKIDELKKLL